MADPISPAKLIKAGLDADTAGEFVSSPNNTTIDQGTPSNPDIRTLTGINAAGDQAIAAISNVSIGLYLSNPTFNNRNEYVNFDRVGTNETYRLKSTTPTPYPVNSGATPDPLNDANLQPFAEVTKRYVDNNTTPTRTLADAKLFLDAEDLMYFFISDLGDSKWFYTTGENPNDSNIYAHDTLPLQLKLIITKDETSAVELGITGDGSAADNLKVINAISVSNDASALLNMDVEGVFNPIFLLSGSRIYVSKTMTLKGNPSTVPQSVTDTLWNIIGIDGFNLTWTPGVVMFSEAHGAYQEFSHAIKVRDGARNGYVGAHTSDGFDGDGLFLLNVANTIFDNPRALRPGRSGISVISLLLNVTINNPYHLGFNTTVGAINLAAIDIEPNEFGDMSLTINKPTGFGQRTTAVGLNVYLELIEVNAVNHGRYNVTVNDPDYVEYNKNYQFSRSTWNILSDISQHGKVSIVRPISTNHTDNAILIESWQLKGGISLDITDPTIILTKSADGTLSSDSGNVIAITRNQGAWVDNGVNGNVNITNIDINDTSGYMHDSYCKIRYGRFANTITFRDIANVTSGVDLVVYPEHVASILNENNVSSVVPKKRAYTSDISLPDDSSLYVNTNEGAAAATSEWVLPLIPIGSAIAIANLAGGSTINVNPPAGLSIGLLAPSIPFPITNSTQVFYFSRISTGRYLAK